MCSQSLSFRCCIYFGLCVCQLPTEFSWQACDISQARKDEQLNSPITSDLITSTKLHWVRNRINRTEKPMGRKQEVSYWKMLAPTPVTPRLHRGCRHPPHTRRPSDKLLETRPAFGLLPQDWINIWSLTGRDFTLIFPPLNTCSSMGNVDYKCK